MEAELIFFNGNLIPVIKNNNEPIEFLAVSQGKIIALGPRTQMEKFKSAKTRIWNLEGKTVLPGFIDSHTHFLQTGLNLNAASLTECSTISAIKELLFECLPPKIKSNKTWLRAHGIDETKLKEKRLPIREELDKISKDIPIFISRIDHHSCILNSKAIEILTESKNLKSVGGESKITACELEGADWDKGYFRAASNYFLRSKLHDLISVDEKKEAIKKAAQIALSKGITTVHALEGGNLFGQNDVEIIQEMEKEIPISIVLYHQITDLGRIEKEGLPRVGGCLLVDGSIGSRTAAFSQEYIDNPGNFGVLYFKDEDLFVFVEKAHREGLQISLHAIGDRAISQAVNAYARAQTKFPRNDARHRIEHAEMPSSELIEKMAALDITLGVQPAFETFWGGFDKMYAVRLGKERVKKTNPFRTYVSHGILLAGGSDSDVTPMDPLFGIASCLTHPNPSERLTIKEALELFTINAAKIAFQEKEKGSLEIGKRADLVILNKNILETNPEQIKDIKIQATIVNGLAAS